ncbi:MAG: thiolase family protein [Micromonosporaceae bacterium]|nr:thiolase family protein [Micromonosporaceae bacterium]
MRDVAIIGVGQTKYQHRYPDTPQPDLVRRAAQAALADAHLRADDLDAVVYSMAPDALIGVLHAERWVADAAGAAGRPMLRVNTGGSTGLSSVQAAYDHIASGMCDIVLVVGADRVGESGDAQTILNRIWDPMYERQMPLNTVTMLAMQGVRFFEKYGATPRDMARVAVKNHFNGVRNPVSHIQKEVTIEEVESSPLIAYPIRLFDCCPQSSGGAAVVLASAEVAERRGEALAWVTGMGFRAESYWMGDRMGPKAVSDHAESPQLAAAADAAYRAAGITAADIGVAELYAPFTTVELHAVQDVGLCPPGTVLERLWEGYFDLDGEKPVTPSGGVQCANPIAVTAMVRVIEAALQVAGRAGDHQVAGVRHALATGIGGDHQFFGAVVVSDRPRAATAPPQPDGEERTDRD